MQKLVVVGLLVAGLVVGRGSVGNVALAHVANLPDGMCPDGGYDSERGVAQGKTLEEACAAAQEDALKELMDKVYFREFSPCKCSKLSYEQNAYEGFRCSVRASGDKLEPCD